MNIKAKHLTSSLLVLFGMVFLLSATGGSKAAEPAAPAKKDSLVARLGAKPSPRETASDVCSTLLKASRKEFAAAVPSPDSRAVAYLHHGEDKIVVRIVPLTTETKEKSDKEGAVSRRKKEVQLGKPLTIFEGKARKNGFGPWDMLWSPDSDRLYVRFGLRGTGAFEWFAFSPSSGKMLDNEREFQRLQDLSIDELPDGMATWDRTDGERHPVWTLGGKQFDCEGDAKKAGYGFRQLFDPTRHVMVDPAFRTHRIWEGRTMYTVFADKKEREWIGHVFKGDKLVGSTALAAPMYEDFIFTEADGELFMRTSALITRSKTTTKGSKGDADGYCIAAASVPLGRRKLGTVFSLGEKGLLISLLGEKEHVWVTVDRSKLNQYMRSQARTSGKKDEGGGERSTKKEAGDERGKW